MIMIRDEFIGKLQMVYVGDKNASADIIVEYDRLNNIIKGYNLILKNISDECYEKKMETGDTGYYDIMEKIDKLIGE